MPHFNVEVMATDVGVAVRALEDVGLAPTVEFREAPRDWMQAVRMTDVICLQVEAPDQRAAADLVWRVVGEQARVSAELA